MKDSIDKNLEFKSFIFVTLLGAWLWLLKYYISIPSVSGKKVIPLLIMSASYIIFYPLIPLGMMLIYSSIYQIEEKKEQIEELVEKYKNSAKAFFGWWPIVLLMSPIFILISIFPDRYAPYVIGIFLVYIFFIKKYLFGKILTFNDVHKYFKIFWKSFFFYLLLFLIIILLTQLSLIN